MNDNINNFELDLSKPIVSPYTYQEYPRMLYGSDGRTVIVASDEEKSAALSNGFSLEPNAAPKPADASLTQEPNPSSPARRRR